MRAPRIASTSVAAALAALAFVAAQSAPRNLDRALAAQRALVAERPADAGAHNDLANLLAVAGDRRGAEAEYLQAIELAPEEPGPRFNYGLLLTASERRLPAFRQFREVVDLDPGHAWAHYQIGTIYDAWGLDRLARRAYARAFRIDPSLADARVNPGLIDNDETTAAMLRAWRGGVSDSLAPREYSEGARIAGLLIDVPKRSDEVAEEEEATEESGAAEGGFARVVRPAGEPADRADATDRDDPYADEEQELVEEERDAGGRVLDTSDLRVSGAANQVSPGSGAGRDGGSSAGSRRTRIQKGGSPGVPPPVFVPDPESTGRLERRLLPALPGDGELAAITG